MDIGNLQESQRGVDRPPRFESPKPKAEGIENQKAENPQGIHPRVARSRRRQEIFHAGARTAIDIPILCYG